MDKTIIKLTEDYVKNIFIDQEPGHDYLHIERVRKMALLISQSVESDLFLVEMLALLHDVEDHKLNHNYRVKDFLDSVNISRECKDKILSILPYMSFSKYPHLDESFPIEGKIVIDADRLDAIGAIGIARAFSYGGYKNRRMYGDKESTVHHFEEKLLILDKTLYLEESKRIAEKRMKFLKEFYEEFLLETK